MKVAAATNINIQDFWFMTPLELDIYMNAYVDKVKLENENSLAVAYTNAALQRSKKMPPLKELIKDKPKQQTTEQMLATVKHLNAMFGGEVNGSS